MRPVSEKDTPILQRRRRRLHRVTAATAAMVVAPMIPVGINPAEAADTAQCAATASFYATLTDGRLREFVRTTPINADGAWSSTKDIGTGWMFGRVLGGPDGRIYGISSTGLYRYRRTAGSWELINGKVSQHISTGFLGYDTPALRNKVTIDELGDFYTIDTTGELRWHRYSEASTTWTVAGQIIDTGWDRYNLIFAAGPGVLYGRTSDGKLYRHRFDPVSQRWILRDKQVGGGWDTYTKGIWSIGGDNIVGLKANGTLIQYRYREDNDSWSAIGGSGKQIGNGWQLYTNSFAQSDACHLTANHTPPRPIIPPQDYPPVNVMQVPPTPGQQQGSIEYAFTDRAGYLRHGRHEADNFTSPPWTPVGNAEAYTGKPGLVVDRNGLVRIIGHAVTGDAWMLTQSTPAGPAWLPWFGLAGAMTSTPTVARLSDSSLVTVALDEHGGLWFRPQHSGGTLLAWQKAAAPNLTGSVSLTPSVDRSAILVATDTNGTLHTATYQDRAVGNWTSLGGTGFTGTPATVLMPGRRLRVFARDAEGRIMTQQQAIDGSFPGTWTLVGNSDFVAVGPPSVVLSPASGLVHVLARAADGVIYHSGEVGQASDTWTDWRDARQQGSTETYASDPTAFTYTNSNGTPLAYVTRTPANQVVVIGVNEGGTSAARSADDVAFQRHDLGRPAES